MTQKKQQLVKNSIVRAGRESEVNIGKYRDLGIMKKRNDFLTDSFVLVYGNIDTYPFVASI